jgi:tellurite resistance protein
LPTSKRIIVPAGFFGIVLGLAGLGSGWRLAAHVWNLTPLVGEAVSLLAAAVWFVLILLFVGKWIWLRAEALAEFRHPVLCCFVGIVPVTTALVGWAIRPYFYPLALVLAIVGVVGQLVFSVYRTGALWQGGRDHSATTPILYLPTVAGSFVSAIVLSAFGHSSWAVPFFGAGLLSWLAIESVLLHRLYVVSELPPPLRPSLGIQLAPPAVGCAAYFGIAPGPPDLFAQSLIGYALFQALVLMRLLPWIARQPFSASYWAFSFGLSALGLDLLRCVERGDTGPLAIAAPYVFAIVNVIIGGLVVGTILQIFRGKLLPPPLVPDSASGPAAAPNPATR